MGSDWKLKLAAFKISNPNLELDDTYFTELQDHIKNPHLAHDHDETYGNNHGSGEKKEKKEIGAHHKAEEIVFVHDDFIVAGEVCDVLLGIIKYNINLT